MHCCETISVWRKKKNKKKRSCIWQAFPNRKKNQILFLHILPLHILPSLSFLSLIVTVNGSFNNEYSNFFFLHLPNKVLPTIYLLLVVFKIATGIAKLLRNAKLKTVVPLHILLWASFRWSWHVQYEIATLLNVFKLEMIYWILCFNKVNAFQKKVLLQLLIW